MQNPNNLHIVSDDEPGDDVGSSEFVTLAAKLSTEHIAAVGDLSSALQHVRDTNLGADRAVELLGNHIESLVTVFEAVVPLIQRRLDNYSKGERKTRGATSATTGVQGILGTLIGPALLNLRGQLPILQGFLETIKDATTPPKIEGEIHTDEEGRPV